jgi:hypothetical protein
LNLNSGRKSEVDEEINEKFKAYKQTLMETSVKP